MSAGLRKRSKIRYIVKLPQMLRRWRNKACMSTNRIQSDVLAGHVAVCVGTSCRRFVVPVAYLNHAVFKKLLIQAEEEYGFSNTGPLMIPCDESVFEDIIRFISHSESGKSDSFVNIDLWRESRPLLNGFHEKITLGREREVFDSDPVLLTQLRVS